MHCGVRGLGGEGGQDQLHEWQDCRWGRCPGRHRRKRLRRGDQAGQGGRREGPREPCLPSGARRPGGLGEDTLYLRSCRAHGVVPASCFLRQGSAPELSLRHRGLGPQVPREGPSSRFEGRGPGRQQPWEGSLPEPTPPTLPSPAPGPRHVPAPTLSDRWDGGYDRAQYKDWGACRAPLTCWGIKEAAGETEKEKPASLGLREGTGRAEPCRQSPGSAPPTVSAALGRARPSGTCLSQGARALARALTSNPYVKRLDLRDNGLCGAGAEALAGALSKTRSICGRF